MNQQDALAKWYQTQDKPQDKQPERPKTYTRAEQLFDVVLYEAEYGDEDKKQFFFAMAERLLKLTKR